MADSASAVLGTAPLPPSDALERAAAFTREPFVFDGEDAASALAPGSPRRRALDAALAELEAGAKHPSVQWRQNWSLLLGLDRVLSQEEPRLVDGTVLNAHQVDALSGTLTALLADLERQENGADALPRDEDAPPLAPVGIPGEAELPQELQEEEEGDEEPQDWSDEDAEATDDEQLGEQPEDPNAAKRFWFEHATGAGKTVAALGFVESSQTGGVLILTHRRNLVDQFHGELRDRGYAKRITPPLLRGQDDATGPVTVETYQWFVRNAGNVSDAYTIIICDEAHTALGEKTSAAIRAWSGPVFIGMTATGALIARHVTDLFPTQTSRFDLAQAARRGVISPLRCVRIPPGPGVRTIAKVPLRRGEVDVEFDQELLAELLDQQPFNLAIADLYKTRFDGVPGVVYAAGVRHAHNVADAFTEIGLKARAVSGETPKRELAQILAAYEHGDIDVLVNAQLLAEGWNSPRATVCLHLAPTASKRIYQQRVGRVTRRHPGKEAGIVVDFVHPATKHDDPVVTLHSLLDREVYRGGAIVVGPVRRGRGRRLRVERRVVPVTADPNRRIEVFERELWRIAVEHLDWGEQVQWAALAGARVTLTGWRRARAMLHFDAGGELKRAFLVTAVQRNKNPQVRLRALQEIAAARDADAFDAAIEVVGGWPREEKREGVKVALQALAEKKLGRRDQANNWIWRCAEYTRDVHEEYAVQRWPETKRLLGLLVNSAAGAHARNARRLVHAARDQDRRLQAALLAAAVPHTAEAGEVVNGARARLARKPPSLARELLKNFPKPKSKKARRRRRKGAGEAGGVAEDQMLATVGAAVEGGEEVEGVETPESALVDGEGVEVAAEATDEAPARRSGRRRRGRRRGRRGEAVDADAVAEGRSGEQASERATGDEAAEPVVGAEVPSDGGAVAVTDAAEADARPKAPKARRTRRTRTSAAGAGEEVDAVATPMAAGAADAPAVVAAGAEDTPDATAAEATTAAPARRRTRQAAASTADGDESAEARPAATRRRTKATAATEADTAAPKKPRRTRKATAAEDVGDAPAVPAAGVTDGDVAAVEAVAPKKPRRTRKTVAADAEEQAAASQPGDEANGTGDGDAPARPTRRRSRAAAAVADADTPAAEAAAPKKPRRTRKTQTEDAPTPAPVADAPSRNGGSPDAEPGAAPDRAADTATPAAAVEATAADASGAKPAPRRRRGAPSAEEAPAAKDDAAAETSAPAGDAAARPRRATSRKTTSAEAQAREAAAADVIAATPRRARTTRRKAPAAVDLADSVQRATEAAERAVRRDDGDDRATDAAA